MTYRPHRMKFGIFMAPFHRVGENPTLALKRDLQLIDHLDELGFDEAWIGEHHSFARELIADPAVFIAAAAQRTRRIKLGTGVTSLPYHHPFIVADKMLQLDHMTEGRAMLGVGPGALTSDAYMMGINPVVQRTRMNEALEAILALLRSREPVNMTTDWFVLKDARLQMANYTYPHLPVAVAASVTPSGPVAAVSTASGCFRSPAPITRTSSGRGAGWKRKRRSRGNPWIAASGVWFCRCTSPTAARKRLPMFEPAISCVPTRAIGWCPLNHHRMAR